MDMRTTILGHEAQLPFFVTSCAGQRMFHADGEVATAKAAKKHGCFMALSQLTTSTFEDVREAHPDGAKCLQLYVWRDRVLLKEVRQDIRVGVRARPRVTVRVRTARCSRRRQPSRRPSP